MSATSTWLLEMTAKLDRQPASPWAALLAAILFGVSTPLAKGLLQGVSPQVLAGLFYMGSGVGLASLTHLPRRGAVLKEAPLTRRDVPWLSGAVVFGGVLAPVLLLTGLQQTPASNASLLLNLESVFTVALAWIAFHENIGRRFTMSLGTILIGSVLISWQGVSLGSSIVGPVAVVVACLCWAVDNNLTQKVSTGNPIQIAAIKGLVAGSVNLLLGVWLGSAWPNTFFLATALVVGFFSYGLSLVLFVLSLRTLGTARTGAYYSTAPFIGAILALLVWREPITPIFAAASGAMAAGVLLLMTERHAHLHAHEPLVHVHLHVHDEHHQHRHHPNDPPGEPHSHLHDHVELTHSHYHYPDIHHRHSHDRKVEEKESA